MGTQTRKQGAVRCAVNLLKLALSATQTISKSILLLSGILHSLRALDQSCFQMRDLCHFGKTRLARHIPKEGMVNYAMIVVILERHHA